MSETLPQDRGKIDACPKKRVVRIRPPAGPDRVLQELFDGITILIKLNPAQSI